MASVHLSSFDNPIQRPGSHQGLHSSILDSQHTQHPVSQNQNNIYIPSGGIYSPVPSTNDGGASTPHAMSTFPPHPQPAYRPFHQTLSIPQSSHNLMSYPATAPPLTDYSVSNLPYDSRSAVPMMRTISHAHQIHSATEQTTSSRYSASPHSVSIEHIDPPTASQYTFHTQGLGIDTGINDRRHIDTSLLTSNGYTMSRSVSGESGNSEIDVNGRLVTPHCDYKNDFLGGGNDHDLREVSDAVGRGMRPITSTAMTHYYLHQENGGNGISTHALPNNIYFGRSYDPITISSERGEDIKPNLSVLAAAQTEYERERQARIIENNKIVDGLGLRSTILPRVRYVSLASTGGSHKKRRYPEEPVRMSTRIASISRASYADLDGGPMSSSGSDGEDEEYSDPEIDNDEDDFRPSKRTKGRKRSGGYLSLPPQQRRSSQPKPSLSLWGLLQVYPEIPYLFPLFYYTLLNDLSINPESVPLIGTIPSTSSPIEKAETLRNYFHRGRRVLAQLDAFTTRCDRKYEGPETRWSELDYNTRIAVRDVRRKVVERCENYKYTRRDILDKIVGKNMWQPIEQGMIEWRVGTTQNDPAGDLGNVTLTLPAPPPGGHQQNADSYPTTTRVIRPVPSRANLVDPQAQRLINRTVSITMASPDDYQESQLHQSHRTVMIPRSATQNYGYHSEPAPPMYGEDEVPMTVQMPGMATTVSPVLISSCTQPSVTPALAETRWDHMVHTPIGANVDCEVDDGSVDASGLCGNMPIGVGVDVGGGVGMKRSYSEDSGHGEW